MVIAGISAYYHDSAAALIKDGRIVAAAQEERFTRIKHDAAFPRHALAYCLQEAGIRAEDVTHVVFYDKPFLKFERLLETYLSFAPRGFSSFRLALPIWLREKLLLKSVLAKELKAFAADVPWRERLLFSEHHLSHAASAFYASPFDEAAVLTLDGVGEWASSSLAIGSGTRLQIQREMHFPHSLGLLYSAFTYHLGFKVNSGEYKVMGLAPYGRPVYAQRIFDHLIDVKDDGSFRLNMDYFEYAVGLTMTNARFAELFDMPVRAAEGELAQHHLDMAASVQKVTEDVVVRLATSVLRETGQRNLCLAGGVALNCVANGKLLRTGVADHIWVQPASGDAGGALGAALYAWHGLLGQPRMDRATGDAMQGSYLGPAFDAAAIRATLDAAGAVYEELDDDGLLQAAATDLANGHAVGWFQGRMEFGPRALGARSILADARSPAMQTVLNLKVKFRESFRPFAPSVREEDVSDWFDYEGTSPYMCMVANVTEDKRVPLPAEADTAAYAGVEQRKLPRSQIPAVTHVDYSARLQTVSARTNARYHALLTAFKRLTGCPVLVNTSFNVRGEPIVHTPEDAWRCFIGTGIDALAVGNFYLRKTAQPKALLQYDHAASFAPD